MTLKNLKFIYNWSRSNGSQNSGFTNAIYWTRIRLEV